MHTSWRPDLASNLRAQDVILERLASMEEKMQGFAVQLERSGASSHIPHYFSRVSYELLQDQPWFYAILITWVTTGSCAWGAAL